MCLLKFTIEEGEGFCNDVTSQEDCVQFLADMTYHQYRKYFGPKNDSVKPLVIKHKWMECPLHPSPSPCSVHYPTKNLTVPSTKLDTLLT
jgi:hypothetical protein